MQYAMFLVMRDIRGLDPVPLAHKLHDLLLKERETIAPNDRLSLHQQSHPADFAAYRNRIGALLLLPKSFNASYGDLPYQEKLSHYNSPNLLARSLHP
jgi:hypothetical protein